MILAYIKDKDLKSSVSRILERKEKENTYYRISGLGISDRLSRGLSKCEVIPFSVRQEIPKYICTIHIA